MSRAQLIISLDCEGKWGMADHITDHHRRCFTNANLDRAYQVTLTLFDKWDVEATFVMRPGSA